MSSWKQINTHYWRKYVGFKKAGVVINKFKDRYNIDAVCYETRPGKIRTEIFDRNKTVKTKSQALTLAKSYMKQIDIRCFRVIS